MVGRTLAEGTQTAGPGAPGAGVLVRRHAEAVVLDDPRPAAYCVAGRPAAIVLTSGALDILDPSQLSAVLAHERAHLAHGDHLLHTLTQGLAAAFPRVPLFTRGTTEVARLTEMAADDDAARANSRSTLIAALLAIATGAAVSSAGISSTGVQFGAVPRTVVPGGTMAATACAVPDRIERLLRPSSPARSAAFAATLSLVLTVLAVAPPALTALLAR